jgi:hypothetical protein
MGLWYRVFGSNGARPEPGAILEHLNGLGPAVTGRFAGDAAGWFRADLGCAGTGLCLERFLATEEGIRAELNSWAAHLEAGGDSPERLRLMERMIQTAQLFTLEAPDGPADRDLAERLCLGLCRFLARATDGVYQVDGRGFFAADGTLLLAED